MQDEYDQFILVADVQALTDNSENPEKVRKNILETTMDNIAVGVDPDKNTFFIQSMIPEIADLTIYFLNLVTLSRLMRNPTVKDEVKQKGYENNIPAGFLCYPVSQAADILCVKASIVPVGEDQLPQIEQANEIVDKFNATYGQTFDRIKPIVPKSGARLSGTDGKSKMGKSLGNGISLSDETSIVKEKVMNMYTDPLHINKNDIGHLEGNVVFEYLDAFDADKKSLDELKENYVKGGIGDVEVKMRLFKILEETLTPIRERRKVLENNPKTVLDILARGTERARAIAKETMKEVRSKMRIDYF